MEATIQGQQTQSIENASADPYYDELKRLFDLYRLASLNLRYYGCRAEKYEWLSKVSLGASAAFSGVALTLLLIMDPSAQDAGKIRVGAAILAGIATLVSGITPYTGWTEKVRDLRSLRFAYSQLFGQLEFAITEIRRAGSLSPEHVGLARMVHEAYTRIESLDEQDPDQKLIDREDAKVRKAFPEDYLWTHF
jgi:hypothetical protein